MSGDPSFSNSMWGQFWSAHQRFFKYLCIAAKVKEAVKCAKEAVKMGKVNCNKFNLFPKFIETYHSLESLVCDVRRQKKVNCVNPTIYKILNNIHNTFCNVLFESMQNKLILFTSSAFGQA